MLHALKTRLRQLWEQCDLFDPPPGRTMLEMPRAPVRPKRPRKHRPPKRRTPSVSRPRPQDRAVIEQLQQAHQRYNTELFGNELRPVPIRISGRMKNRLGHYMSATSSGWPAEIAISRRHIRLDTWDDVIHTLIHEMVHQWQDENGLPIDHGAHFRHKAREVGITARATRQVN